MLQVFFLFISLFGINEFNTCQSSIEPIESIDKLPVDTIPFRLTSYNNMVVKAVLNQVDTLDLMFHTAANTVTLKTADVPRLKNFKLTEVDSAESWGGSYEIQSSLNNQLQIGDLKWDSLQIWQNEKSGHETQGKFGINFFTDQILEINFDNNYLLIHEELPDLAKTYVSRKLIKDRGFFFLEGKSNVNGAWLTNRFLIHSGFGGALLYDDAFTKKNELDTHLAIISESELKDSAGNVLKTQKAVLPAFQFEETKIKEVPVSFFTGSIKRQQMSVLGGDLLKRYNWIFDFENEVVYLKSNTLSQLPFKDV
ncbi:MAG: hypothetical protein Sapg2KO_03750 [Saprospiraceae bacterium]